MYKIYNPISLCVHISKIIPSILVWVFRHIPQTRTRRS